MDNNNEEVIPVKTKPKIQLMLLKIVMEEQEKNPDDIDYRNDVKSLQKMGTKAFFKHLSVNFETFKCRSEVLKKLLADFAIESARRKAEKSKLDKGVVKLVKPSIVKPLVPEVKKLEPDASLNVTVGTFSCTRCKGEVHSNLQVYVDKKMVPYVLCCSDLKRTNIHLKPNYAQKPLTFLSLKDVVYPTVFVVEDGNTDDIARLHQLLGE